MIVTCKNQSSVVQTVRVSQLAGLFDLPVIDRSSVEFTADLPFEEKDWQIGLIVGPSGSGKTTLARELFGDHVVTGFDWPSDKAVIDGFESGGIKDITGALSSVGFSSPPSWLRPFRVLSTGEQFRATVARALLDGGDLVVMDEWTSVVDRTVAQVASAAAAKSVRRGNKQLVAVSCHDDVAEWLQPDWIFRTDDFTFHWGCLRPRPDIRLEVMRAHRKAWRMFNKFHYLTPEINHAAQCFVATWNGRAVCFVAALYFPHRDRPRTWRGHRTVCLPDYQGVGIGNALSDHVASLFVAAGYCYISRTSHPAMRSSRNRSAKWTSIGKPNLATPAMPHGLVGGKVKQQRRLAESFEYVGGAFEDAAMAREMVA